MSGRKNPVVDLASHKNSKECGLSAVRATDLPILDDKVPAVGFIIMLRTANVDNDKITYLWQIAKILGLGGPSAENSGLIKATLRINPLTRDAFTKDVALGPENCGDGSKEGTCWFRVVNKADHQKSLYEVFYREEKAMLQRNLLIKDEVRGDGHCYRRALLTVLYGKGSDTPTKLREMQLVLALGLEMYADDLDAMALEFSKSSGFGTYCRSRADLLRGIESSIPCPRSEWGGGDYGCENFVLARLMSCRVLISTPMTSCFCVYKGKEKFEVRHERVSDYEHLPGDIVISHVWDGTHFIPYIWQGKKHTTVLSFNPR